MLKLSEIAMHTATEIIGNKNFKIDKLSDISSASSNDIVVVLDESNFNNIDFSKFGAVLTSINLSKKINNSNLLVSTNPKLAFARLTKMFVDPSAVKLRKVSSNGNSYYVGENVEIDENFKVGLNVVIESSVSIGKNVELSHNVVILHGTKIGDNVKIDSGTVIGSEGFGNFYSKEKNSWEHINHLGNVNISNNVMIGSNCSIDRGTLKDTIIESGVIIDNQVHIAHNCFIGENTAIAANTAIAGSCFIGKRNLIGGLVGIVDHITTTDDVVISATSTVFKNINDPGIYTGIMPISKHSSWKRIAFWVTKLDKIVKKFNIK